MKIYICSILAFVFSLPGIGQQRIILDADTGNEMDDLYAIVAALLSDSLEVTALISAHFNNPQLLTDSVWHVYPTENINTVEISQRENQKLLRSLDRTDVPHPRGADRMVGYAWGYYPGAPIPESEGTRTIIKHARQATPDDKLTVVCLGAVTNVVAAMLTDSTIARNIRLYLLGMNYNPNTRVWDKNEFNARNDLNALDLVLNSNDLEVYVIPASVAGSLVFQRESTLLNLRSLDTPSSRILANRWEEVSAGDRWTMWDLALIEALIHPENATLETGPPPPENTASRIHVYTAIDARRMESAFWARLRK